MVEENVCVGKMAGMRHCACTVHEFEKARNCWFANYSGICKRKLTLS